MKFVSRTVVVCALVALIGSFLAAGSAEALALGYTGNSSSWIQFLPNGTVRFDNDGPNQYNDFEIVLSDSAAMDSVGLTGDLDGEFQMGPITNNGAEHKADLTGPGVLSIDDGVGNIFTADFVWVDIATFFNFGAFNVAGVVNLTNLVYAGSNADLASLLGSPDGVIQASFTAAVGQNLTSLRNGAVRVSNYAGTITGSGAAMNAPEPSAALCFAVGSLVVGAACRRRR